MTVTKEAAIQRYIGLSSDSKPTGVPVGSTFLEHDTDAIYITHDGGTTWVLKGLTPGTGAANLGKAEDAAHASGDTGVQALAVRKDTAAALAGADGDYAPLEVDASGRLHIAPAPANDGVDIGNVDVASQPVFGTIAVGELAGSATAAQMPSQACRLVKFKAAYDNAGRVYIGGSGVTKKDGTTDTTTGLELSAGEETGWLPVSNLNVLYRICDNAGDDLTYLAMVS